MCIHQIGPSVYIGAGIEMHIDVCYLWKHVVLLWNNDCNVNLALRRLNIEVFPQDQIKESA